MKVTYNLDPQIVREVRNVVVALSGPPARLTLSGFVEAALSNELERFRSALNQGKPFAGAGTPLRGGRPIKDGAA